MKGLGQKRTGFQDLGSRDEDSGFGLKVDGRSQALELAQRAVWNFGAQDWDSMQRNEYDGG